MSMLKDKTPETLLPSAKIESKSNGQFIYTLYNTQNEQINLDDGVKQYVNKQM